MSQMHSSEKTLSYTTIALFVCLLSLRVAHAQAQDAAKLFELCTEVGHLATNIGEARDYGITATAMLEKTASVSVMPWVTTWANTLILYIYASPEVPTARLFGIAAAGCMDRLGQADAAPRARTRRRS